MNKKLTVDCPNFSVMHATMTDFGMHAGKKFNTQNKEFMNISIILSVCLPIHHVQ